MALELKTDEGVASALQSHNIKKILNCGSLAYIVSPSNWEAVHAEIKHLSKGGLNG